MSEAVQKSPIDLAIAARNSGKSPHPPLDPYKNERRSTPGDLDPGTFGEKTFPHLSRNSSALLNAQSALRGLHKVETEVHALQAEGHAGPKIAERALPEALRAIGTARERIELLGQMQVSLVGQMSELLPKVPYELQGEIRAWVGRQSSPLAAAMSLIQSGDMRSTAAVLSGPFFLSELDDKQGKIFTTAARKRFTPEQQALLEDIERAVPRIEAAIKSFDSGLMPRLRRWTDEAAKDRKIEQAFKS